MTPEQIARALNHESQKHYDEGCRDTINLVLKIIDSICDDFCTEELNCIPLVTRVSEIREAVETMKEGNNG